jgi:hypothetical protein
MREIRLSGLEGGETQSNASSLPLSFKTLTAREDRPTFKMRTAQEDRPSAPSKASKQKGASPFMGLIWTH